jgi:hypothetical protein
MKNLNFGLCVAGATLASSAVIFVVKPAQAAAFFNYNNTFYEIKTVTGSYNDLETRLQATPWWGDSVVAESAALAGFGLGWVQDVYGPSFAYGISTFPSQGTFVNTKNIMFYCTGCGKPIMSGFSVGALNSGVYAIATAVPEPLTILGSITAAGFGVAFKRKLAKSKKDEKDA